MKLKQYIEIKCRHCGNDDLVKNGRSENGTQRYRCNECGRSFQNEYSYNAWNPRVKDQIELQTLNNNGVRDIGRNFGISKNTVISELKKNPAEVNPYFIPKTDGIKIAIPTDMEADEVWRYVGRKKIIRCGLERKTGVILAWHLYSRLMVKISAFPVIRYYLDDWQRYRKHIPASEHSVGKANTWRK